MSSETVYLICKIKKINLFKTLYESNIILLIMANLKDLFIKQCNVKYHIQNQHKLFSSSVFMIFFPESAMNSILEWYFTSNTTKFEISHILSCLFQKSCHSLFKSLT